MSTLHGMIGNGEIEAVLVRSIEDREARSAVRARSYRHFNGFSKIVLSSLGSRGGELRLHTWTAADGSQGDRHTHPWSFSSYVLKGLLINELFEEERGTDYLRLNIGPVGGGQDGYNIVADGRCNLVCTASMTLPAGSEYHLDPSLIHNAYSPVGAITLMHQGTFSREVTFGYRRGEVRADKPELLRFTDDEIVQTLRDALASIA